MEAAELFKLVIENGISATLAAVVIYWYRVDSKERIKNSDKRTEDEKKRTAQERDDKLLLIETIQENTQIMAKLEMAVSEWMPGGR